MWRVGEALAKAMMEKRGEDDQRLGSWAGPGARVCVCGLIGYQELRFRRLDKQMCSRTAIATMQKQKGSLVQGGWCRRTWGWEEREE